MEAFGNVSRVSSNRDTPADNMDVAGDSSVGVSGRRFEGAVACSSQTVDVSQHGEYSTSLMMTHSPKFQR